MSTPILHIWRHSPTGSSPRDSYLRVLAAGHHLLLIEDAVYGLTPDCAAMRDLVQLPTGVHVYVLESDLLARGLALADLPSRICPIGYEGMVKLCEQSGKVISW